MSHTKGKWEVGGKNGHGERIIRGEHLEICTCWHHCITSLEEEMDANAHRIVHCVNVHDELLSWARIGLGYSRMLQDMSIDFDEEESKLLDNYEQAIKHAEEEDK